MRHCKTNERHRTTERCDNGCQKTGHAHRHGTHCLYIHSKIHGIGIAKQQGIQRLCHSKRHHQQHKRHRRKERHLRHRDATERAHSPNHIRVHTLGCRKIVEQCDCRRCHVTDSNTRYQQEHIVTQQCGKQQYYHYNEECSGKSTAKHCKIAAKPECRHSTRQQHDKCHSKPGTAIHSKNLGTGKRVTEKSLQQQSGDRYRCTGQQCRQSLRQAGLKHHHTPHIALGIATCQY